MGIRSRMVWLACAIVTGCLPPNWQYDENGSVPVGTTVTSGGGNLGRIIGGPTSGGNGDDPASSSAGDTTGGGQRSFSCGSPRSGTGATPVTALPGAPDGIDLVPVSSSPVRLSRSTRTALLITATGTTPGNWNVAWTGSNGLAFQLPRPVERPSRLEDPQSIGERRIVEIQRRWLLRSPSRRVQAIAISPYAGPGTIRTFQMIDGTSGSSVPVTTEAIQDVSLDDNRKVIIWADRRDLAQVRAARQAMSSVLETFRESIYPLETCAFGGDPLPSSRAPVPDRSPILADAHLHLVFSSQIDSGPSEGLLGYFAIADLMGLAEGNQGKVLHLATSTLTRDIGDLLAVVAHEFQHLLFSCHRIQAVGRSNHLREFADPDQTWLNEGLSMQAMLLTGFGPEGRTPSPAIISQVAAYLEEPHLYSMTGFYGASGNPSDAYGMVTLFVDYLVSRLGDEVLSALHDPGQTRVIDSATGLLEPLLAARGMTMDGLFADFAVALSLDDSPTFKQLPGELRSRLQIPGVNLYRGSDGNTAPYLGLDGPVALGGPVVRSSRGTLLMADRPRAISLHVTQNLEAGQQLSGGAPPSDVVARLLTLR